MSDVYIYDDDLRVVARAIDQTVVIVDGQPPAVKIEVPEGLTDVNFPQEVIVRSEQVDLLFPVVGIGQVQGQQVWGETPSGVIDGVNRDYTSANAFIIHLLAVYLNGLRQKYPDDYSETGSQSFRFNSAPLPGDSLSIDYTKP